MTIIAILYTIHGTDTRRYERYMGIIVINETIHDKNRDTLPMYDTYHGACTIHDTETRLYIRYMMTIVEIEIIHDKNRDALYDT
jgi:hypothetical protein